MEIKTIRQNFGLTQQAMSDITGIPKRTIEDWECGRRNPPSYIPKLVETYLSVNAGLL